MEFWTKVLFQDYILNNVDVMAYNYFPLPIHRNFAELSNEQAVNWIKDVILEGNEVKANWKLAWERISFRAKRD